MWQVIKFEVLRALKKRSFWFASFAPPLIILAIIGIEYSSNQNAAKNIQAQEQAFSQTAKIAVLDESGLVSGELLAQQHINTEPDKEAGIAAVKSGEIDAFFYYPPQPATANIEVYARKQGADITPPYNAPAIQLLRQSVIDKVKTAVSNDQVVEILQKNPGVTDVTYENGQETKGTASIIAPGIFLGIFLVLVVLLAYFMITSTAEEKQNRVAEILLTAIETRTIIVGKIVSIFILGFVQIAAIAVPLLAAHLAFPERIALPGNIPLSQIPLDPVAIAFGLAFALAGLLLYTAFLVGLGAMFPGTNEAGRFLGVAIIWAFVPIYSISLIISSPQSLIVRIFTYFPLTAPTTALLRNAIGSLSAGEGLAALAIVILSDAAAVGFAIRAFRYGAMEYGRRVSLKELWR